MSDTNTNPTQPATLDVLKDQFFTTAAEAEEIKIDGNIVGGTLKGLWILTKLLAIGIVMVLVLFIVTMNLALRLRPVAHAHKANIGSVISSKQAIKRWSDTSDAGRVVIDFSKEFIASKEDSDPAVPTSARQLLIQSVDEAFALLSPEARTTMKLDIVTELATTTDGDFYDIAKTKLGL